MTPPTMTPFDLSGPLPTGTTLLEASAGTGKTYAIAALVTRYVAEGGGRARRAAGDHLRPRRQPGAARAGARAAGRGRAARWPTRRPPTRRRAAGACSPTSTTPRRSRRRQRLRDALADFDAATIATTHQFCQQVLRSLGRRRRRRPGATLVENLDDLVVEVGRRPLPAPLRPRPDAARRSTAATRSRWPAPAVGDPQAALAPAERRPRRPPAARRVSFAATVRARGRAPQAPARRLSPSTTCSTRLARRPRGRGLPRPASGCASRWRIVLVDEFQDTDPVQWEVLDRAFAGHVPLVLIGDPKQAIYAFRGGDVVTYLAAAPHGRHPGNARRPTGAATPPLVDRLQALLRGAALGDPRIAVHPVAAHHRGPARGRARVRAAAAAAGAPRRLPLTRSGARSPSAPRATTSPATSPPTSPRLLASGATSTGEPGRGRRRRGAGAAATTWRLSRRALADRGIPSVVSGGGSVMLTRRPPTWLTLLEALEQPHRSGRVRAAALTPFVGTPPRSSTRAGTTSPTTRRAGPALAGPLLRGRGVAAVHEAGEEPTGSPPGCCADPTASGCSPT